MESVLEKLSQIEIELQNIKTNYQPKEPVELMTRQEVADFFQISLVTVHDWTKREYYPAIESDIEYVIKGLILLRVLRNTKFVLQDSLTQNIRAFLPNYRQ